MKKLNLALVFAFLLTAAAPCMLWAQSEESPLDQAKKIVKAMTSQNTSYLRVVKGKSAARLETACVTFENLDVGSSVTLIAAVHIADPSYYRALQDHLKKYDTVFYEGVKQDGKQSEAMSLVSRLQSALKDSLGLAFQPKRMDMTKSNMTHADLTATELQGMLKEKGVGLLPNQDLIELFGPIIVKGLRMLAPVEGQAESPLKQMIRRRMKTVFAEVLAKGVQIYDKLKKPEDRARDELLIGARNAKAMQLLKEAIKENPQGKYAILYGGAHHPDFEKRLINDLGMQKTNVAWLRAWDMSNKRKIRPTPHPDSKPAKKPKKKTVL